MRKPIEWISGRVLACGAPATSGNRFPDGIVYAPVPVPKSALLASAAVMLSLTLNRSSLPRRSLVLSALRRESPVSRWYQPPCWEVAVATVPPVRAAPSALIWFWSDCCSARRKNTLTFAVCTGPPLVWMLLAPTFESASSAASTCAAVAFHASGAVVWPL